FIGLSELWFNNSRYTAAIFNILTLVALFWLLYLLLGSSLLSSALVTLFSFEKVFLAQMQYAPLLDNIQLFFVLMSFAFFVKFYKSGKLQSLVPAMLTLGLVISTKFWITGFTILVVWLLSLLANRDFKKIKYVLLALPLTLAPLLASYYQSFVQGMTIREFFGTQKYIYSWHSAKLEFNPIAVWDFLLFGRWHNQGEIKQAVDWQLTWPIIGILSILAIYQLIKQYKKSGAKDSIYIIGIWFIVYFALLSVSTVNARYLFPILPAMYALSGWVIKEKLRL
ncbi:MAG: phospholipid carrier-dependent glycosyltransferase, partial [bacterium]|nr:phospholipid carrier-dependent glycosyltransferase [bacterium]